jgi:small subunit ribosomal protein S20
LANTKAAIKEIRVARARQERNKSVRSQTKTAMRKAEELITGTDKDAAKAGVKAAQSQLQKAVSQGNLHRRNAARRSGRLARKLNKASAAK